MLFNKKYYYNYIKNLETAIILKSFLIIIVFTFFGFLLAYVFNKNYISFSCLFCFIAVFCTYFIYQNDKIKIEEMKMKFDIYEKLMK